MPESFIGLPPDSTGKKTRTQQRVVGANTVDIQYVIPTNERAHTFEGMSSSFRITGQTATPHNLFTCFNAAASPVIVGVRRLTVQQAQTGTTAYTTAAHARTWRTTAAGTGGSALVKHAFDTAETSNANFTMAAAASADGTATAITQTLPTGNPAWSGTLHNFSTAVGQWLADDNALLPLQVQEYPFYLRPGQGLLTSIVGGAVATTSYVINIVWEEFTLP